MVPNIISTGLSQLELLKIVWSNSSIQTWSTSKDWKTGSCHKKLDLLKSFSKTREPPIYEAHNWRSKIKLWHLLNLWKRSSKIRESSVNTFKYDIIDYGVMVKNSFIKRGKSCLHWSKIPLGKELGCLVQKYRVSIWKIFFLICYQTHFQILFQIWE